MKSSWQFLLFIVVISMLSCKTQPTELQTATVKGQVVLVGSYYGDFTPPYNGIQVSLKGTSFSTTTDDNGLFEFDGVPGGTYDVYFSKAGYGEIRWMSKTIQGGGDAAIYWYDQQPGHNIVTPTLFRISECAVTLQSATLKDTNLNNGYGLNRMTLVGSYTNGLPYQNEVVVYFSHHSSLSSQPGKYDWYECWSLGGALVWDTVQRKILIPIDRGDYRSHGFNSGDSVCFALYGAPNWGQGQPYFDYYDPSIREGVLTSINQTPSPVFGLKIP